MYIVFEGIVGTGKTTQSKKLHRFLKMRFPKKEIVWTREPGGSEIADDIREVVQGKDYSEDMEPICEAYLYAASRAQTLRSIVKPVLEKGGIVIADRSFITSLSYQAHALGIGLGKVMEINAPAIKGMTPDLVIYMDLDPKIGLPRTSDKDGDKHEKKELNFFITASEGYEDTSKLSMFKDKWVNINASQNVEEVFNEIKGVVLKKLRK